MASRVLGAGGFAVGAGLRAAAIGGLAFLAILAASHRLYATAMVLGAIAALVALDLVRSTRAADRVLAQFVEGLVAEGYERPAAPTGLKRLAGAIEGALDRLARARAERQQRIDFLESLADTVSASLLVLDQSGTVVTANRAARLSLRATTGPLSATPGLGDEAAQRLLDLRPGARDVVRLADNRSAFVQAAVFAAPGGGRLRLISLQAVAGELDAVELKAWQDLVRVLAHEMMNSLTPVCSLSESIAARLRETAEAGEMAEAMDVIARRSAGLMSFVERYRRLADVPAAAKEKVALGEIARRLERLMAPAMTEAQIDFAVEVQPAGLSVQADPDLLEQALINLVKNAADAVRGRPGPRVRLTAHVEDDAVAILVEDNGPGLPAEDPEAAFVPFYTTKAGGSGVGLTLARQVALAHGGRLEHRPAPGGGALFRLVLPA